MALCMIRSLVPTDNRNEILKRYANSPTAGEGIRQVGDWASVLGDGAYHLMEADDPKHIAGELLKYSDLCTYIVDPVIAVDDFFELLQKHKLT